ncbi:MAG: LrgB family protein [Comamonas sp.]|jgi:predicted murein hydrolase (TIGR00659 family)|uniref:LrgB family protein n=1 Tax=Comamonas sp. TaxID=34028 RepID=UPI002819D7CB|nr:LrgB family protein [Comamonas sp.]MDR0213825.1 LrgB family protein [Comamonas sp.]MDR2297248.1 LrgB family protein [Comamonas sp.]
MPDFVQLWVYLSSAPLFGLTATLAVYVVAHALYVRSGQAPWANPVLWSVVVLGTALLVTQVPYPTYFAGAQFIHFLLGPAVVALGFPLWERRVELQRNWGRFLAAALAGGATAAIVAVSLGWAVGLPQEVLRSLAPKSVTAPVAMGVAEKIGGVPALAAVFAVLTGLIGALSARGLFRILRIGTSDVEWVARGFGLGTVSHGIGAARALQVNADAGAYAGLALSLQVLLAALLMPLVARWF